MSDLDTVRRLIEAFNRRDASVLTEYLHPDIEFMPVTARVLGQGGGYRGLDGLQQYLKDVTDLWYELRIDVPELRAAAGGVVGIGRVYARGPGGLIDAPAFWVFKMKDGKVVRLEVFSDERQARAAAGVEIPDALPDTERHGAA